MKKIISAVVVSVAAFLIGCNSSDNNSKGTTETSNTSDTTASTSATDSTRGNLPRDTTSKMQSTGPVDNESKEFVLKAAGGGMMEVEAGKIAQQKAQSQRVKDFGSMMVTDHSQANDVLKGIASAKNISIPSALPADEQKHIDELNKMSGAGFDKMYMNMMVDDHKKDVGEFKKASQNLKDADIKNFAGKTLPALQKHLDSAQAIHGK